jgi:hypothetical protein
MQAVSGICIKKYKHCQEGCDAYLEPARAGRLPFVFFNKVESAFYHLESEEENLSPELESK